MYQWTPPRGYKGLRTQYRQAICVKLNQKTIAGKPIYRDYNITLAMEEWCELRCRHYWSHVDGYWWFDRISEAVMFKMTFGGNIDS